MLKVAVVGAGLAGSMIAALLNKFPDIEITVYEKRPNPQNDAASGTSSIFGNVTSAVKRSINLALSHRGIVALEEVGLASDVLSTAIRMPKRVIHQLDGNTLFQPYGKSEAETLYSVSREYINNVLADFLREKNVDGSTKSKVRLFYGYSLQSVDKDGTCVFHTPEGTTVQETYDLVIGADGAYSAVRENMLKQGRVDFSRNFVRHGYKELNIPPVKKVVNGKEVVEYALSEHEGLHIWPRGEFMLIALPNPDKSFTATLFAPYQSQTCKGGFDSVDRNNPAQILEHFQKNFPDVVPLMPELVKDYRDNVVGSLVTVRTNPWNVGKIVLIGDAAHAVVPFFGQGMNCAFQDGFELYQTIKRRLYGAESNDSSKGTADRKALLLEAVNEFAQQRVHAANALADLSLEHYHDMASNTASYWYLFKKQIEKEFSKVLPNVFKPLYHMVAFTSIPYHHAVERARKQEVWVERILAGASLAVLAGVAFRYSHDIHNFVRDKFHS